MTTEFTKQVLEPGNGVDRPKKGDQVSMQYTGWLYDPSKEDNDFKGSQFDSSEGRGDFKTAIGVGRVITGWDEGIIGNDTVEGMTLGEKARLTIPSGMAYGPKGYPGAIPPNATLVFDVHLVGINGKHA